MTSKPATLTTRQVPDLIFKDPQTQYSLSEFDNLGKSVHKTISLQPKTIKSGRDAGKTKYFLKSLIPFSPGNEEFQVYADGGKSALEKNIP